MAKKPNISIANNKNKKDEETNKLVETLEHLPEAERLSIFKQISMKSYSGPIMPPEYAQHYEEILTGSAERILIMSEKQANHRMECEKKALDAQIEIGCASSKRADKQIIGAFLLIFAIICSGCAMITLGHETAGITIFGLLGVSGFTSLIGHFVNKKRDE